MRALTSLCEKSNVVKDRHKVILRGPQQVWTENDSQGFGCQVIMFFVVSDASKEKRDQSHSKLVTRQRTCQDVLTLVEGYQN